MVSEIINYCPFLLSSFSLSPLLLQNMQLFPARFLHSLLLRLAFNFAAANDDSPTPGQTLNRACNLWKNGIHWFSHCGTESYVELREDSQVMESKRERGGRGR